MKCLRFSKFQLFQTIKYFENHPNTANIKRKDFDTTDTSFAFRETNSNEVIKFIKTLNINKTCQNAHTSKRLLSQVLIFLPIIYFENFVFKKVNFLVCLKILTLYMCMRKKKKQIKKIIDRASSPICLTFRKNYLINNCMIILFLFFYQNNVIFLKVTVCEALPYGYTKEIERIK